MYNIFKWDGKVIPPEEMEQWCKDHNTKLVKVRYTKTTPNIFSGKIDTHEKIIEMPEIFLNNMRFSSDERYEVVK